MEGKFLRFILLFLIQLPYCIASANQCSNGMCVGEITSSHISVLAKEIVSDLTEIGSENFEVNCTEKQDGTWHCFLKQLPGIDEVLPPGRFWNVDFNLVSGEYKVFGAF